MSTDPDFDHGTLTDLLGERLRCNHRKATNLYGQAVAVATITGTTPGAVVHAILTVADEYAPTLRDREKTMPRLGPGRIATYLAGTWPTPVVPRPLLLVIVRALADESVGDKISHSLRNLRRDGHASYTPDTITVHDQAGVMASAYHGVDPDHPTFDTATRAARRFTELLARDRAAARIEARDRELQEITDLAAGPYGRGLPGNGRPTRVVGAGRATR